MNIGLAWRNVWRNRRRTVLTGLAIAFCCAILVFFNALQQSSYGAAIEATTSILQGHAQIQAPGYQKRPQIRTSLKDLLSVTSKVAQLEAVHGAAPRALGFALASSEERSYGVQVMGVDPEAEPLVSTIPKQVRKGAYLKSPQSYELVLGEVLARNLKLKVGQELTLLGQGRDGSLAVGVFTVAGIFSSGSPELDKHILQIPLQVFDEVFSMYGQGHIIALRGKSVDDAASLAAHVQKFLDREFSQSMLVLDWEQLSPGLRQMIDLDMASGWLFFSSLILIVVFSVLNSFAMSLLERTREFGVLLAVGVSRLRIAAIVFFECLLLLIIGILPGALLGCAVVYYYGVVGFSVPGSEEVMKLWNLPVAIYPKVTLFAVLLGPLIMLGLSIIAVIVPIARLWKLEPVEAMRAV